ncbi:MAG: hypothetical protein V1494_04255 [Candidatus Diapherotrites archaeon]
MAKPHGIKFSRSGASKFLNQFYARKKQWVGGKSELDRLKGELKLNQWFIEQTEVSLLAPQTLAEMQKRIAELETEAQKKRK